MTERQRRFVDEYLILKGRNGTQAAINAGYSPKTAYSIACENLKKPESIFAREGLGISQHIPRFVWVGEYPSP